MQNKKYSIVISIHSLRMEGDSLRQSQSRRMRNFNPLPPHGGRHFVRPATDGISSHFNPLPPHGGRRRKHLSRQSTVSFQSTPSAWRETNTTEIPLSRLYFNPLPPHGGRQEAAVCLKVLSNFNPLPPHGGRLRTAWKKTVSCIISIHSLRMEGDGRPPRNHTDQVDFNPLPPHGGRPISDYSI